MMELMVLPRCAILVQFLLHTSWCLNQSHGIIAEREKAVQVHDYAHIYLQISPAANEPVLITTNPQDSSVVHVQDTIVIPENSSEAIFRAQCVQVGIVEFFLQENTSVISNIDRLGFTVTCMRSKFLGEVSSVIGWLSFSFWMLAFYPQLWINFRNSSVRGISLNFLVLNTVGYFCYSIFNSSLYFSTVIQHQFHKTYPQSAIPVKLNDVCFSVHGFVICCVFLVQTVAYRRTIEQQLFLWTKIFLVTCVLYMGGLGALAYVPSIQYFTILEFLYYISYIKLLVTAIKYPPQAYLNYQRKSTLGFSYGQVTLDFSGSFLSLTQCVLDAANGGSWAELTRDPTRTGLGALGMFYNLVFYYQRVYYTNKYGYITIATDIGP